MSTPPRPSVPQLLSRPILFVSGKGGVGKTSVSQAIARGLAASGKKTLWVGFEDPTLPPGELKRVTKSLFHLNCVAELAFEEYVGMKLRIPGLAQIFTRNPLIQFLAKAGPGIHELVLLGKLWHERENYDHIVADMPSTGFGLAMFQSIENWSKLFRGGPLHQDAEKMLETFADPATCGHLIVALPEEMPLRESLELEEFLLKLFPENVPGFLVNRGFPNLRDEAAQRKISANPDDWSSPMAESLEDFAFRRSLLEEHNLRIWREAGIDIQVINWQPVQVGAETPEFDQVTRLMERDLQNRGWL